MLRLKTETFIFLLIVLLLFPGSLFSENLLFIQTGNRDSASWQFTKEFSSLWKRKFPDSGFSFTPKYISNINDRFSNLDSKKNRFAISPYMSFFDNLSMINEVKIIAVLWEVYLVPIELGFEKHKVSTNTHKYWYIPNQSVIIPSILKSSSQNYLSDEIASNFNEYQGTQILTGEYVYPTPERIIEEKVLLTDETDATNDLDMSGFDDEFDLSNATGDLQLDLDYLKLNESNPDLPDETDLVEIPEIEFENGEFLNIKHTNLKEVIETYKKGVVFYEMLGSLYHFKKEFDKKLKIVELQDDFKSSIIKSHPWLSEFELKRYRFKTVSFRMVLYAHESEDTELVEKILETLSEQPKTLFPRSYILKNLAYKQTPKISPLLLHQGTLKFFNLN